MANCYWVGGTATWDTTNTGGGGAGGIKWASASGGSTAASGSGTGGCPGAGDNAILDASSGGGTVTVNYGGLLTLTGIDCSAFTGTLDFATNNNNVTLTGTGNVFTGGTTATKTINMGGGTWTLSGSSATFSLSGANANLTFNANGSTLAFTGAGAKVIIAGGKTFNAVTAAASNNTGYFNINSGSALVAASLSIAAPNLVWVGNTGTFTTLSVTGASASSPVLINSDGLTTKTINLTNNFACDWCSFANITFSGGTNTANNSFGRAVTGITISPPSGGAAAPYVIG